MNRMISSMNKQPVYILGAGGHTRSLINVMNHLTILGIIDKSFDVGKTEIIADIPIIDSSLNASNYNNIIISSGNPVEKEKWYSLLNEKVFQENLIHPSSIIEQKVSLGQANQIMAFSYINSCTVIGNNNLINTRSIIEHENRIGDNNHISIGVCLGGRVSIGSRCYIGAGAVIRDKVSLCNDVIIGANSLVLKDITEPGTYIGSPVRKIKE